MADLQIHSVGAGRRRGMVVVSRLDKQLIASVKGSRGEATILVAAEGEEPAALRERARRQLRELEAIEETIGESWPRVGEAIDEARTWQAMGFVDAQVVEWLEAGVSWATVAAHLRDAGVAPREVGGEYELGVTLGLAFLRGDVTLDQVLELRRPAGEAAC